MNVKGKGEEGENRKARFGKEREKGKEQERNNKNGIERYEVKRK